MRIGEPPPPTPEDVDSWLTEIEDDTARLVARELGRLIDAAVTEFISTVTTTPEIPPAATITADGGHGGSPARVVGGDLTALGRISTGWRSWVARVFAERLAGIHLTSAFGAWLSASPQTIPEPAAAGWAEIVNRRAVDFQATATNRLVAVGDNLWHTVRAKTVAAMEQGLTIRELRNEIAATRDFALQRAEVIARTEVVGAYNAGDADGMAALGEYGPVEKVWVATRDSRTRKTHKAAADQVVAADAEFVVGGRGAQRPHDPSLPPGEVIQCRCIVEYLFPGDLRPDGSRVPERDGSESVNAQIDDGLLTDEDRERISAEQDAIAERTLRRIMLTGE